MSYIRKHVESMSCESMSFQRSPVHEYDPNISFIYLLKANEEIHCKKVIPLKQLGQTVLLAKVE